MRSSRVWGSETKYHCSRMRRLIPNSFSYLGTEEKSSKDERLRMRGFLIR